MRCCVARPLVRMVGELLSRLHGWLRYWLWYIAITLMILFVLALMFGSWHRAWNIWTWVIIGFVAFFFGWNIWGGWVEWRGRRDGDR